MSSGNRILEGAKEALQISKESDLLTVDGKLKNGNPFNCGIIVYKDKIIGTPPLLRWAYGKNIHDFVEYADKRKWTVEPRPHREPSPKKNPRTPTARRRNIR